MREGHPIWRVGLFKKSAVNKDEAECTECKKTLKLSDRSNKSLIGHIESEKHKNSSYKEQYDLLMASWGNNKQAKPKQTDQIEDFFVRSSGNLSQTDKRIINLIACENLPFARINSPHFKAVCKDDLNDESHYRKKIPAFYEAVKRKILDELDECVSISCTSDIWSGPNNAFISLTVDGLTEKFNRKHFVLAVRNFEGIHGAAEIATMIENLLKEWKIEFKKISAFVTDGASNYKKVLIIIIIIHKMSHCTVWTATIPCIGIGYTHFSGHASIFEGLTTDKPWRQSTYGHNNMWCTFRAKMPAEQVLDFVKAKGFYVTNFRVRESDFVWTLERTK